MAPPRTAQMWGTAQKLGPTNLNMIEFEGSTFIQVPRILRKHVPSLLFPLPPPRPVATLRRSSMPSMASECHSGRPRFCSICCKAGLGNMSRNGGSGGMWWSQIYHDPAHMLIDYYTLYIKTPFIDGTTHYHAFNLYNPCYICWILLVTVYLQLPNNIKQLHWVCLNKRHAEYH